MILPSRRALRWIVIAAVLFAALVVSYVRYVRTTPIQNGGTPAGIAYGVLATVLVLILAGFGIRKRSYRSTWGTLDGWLQSHLYLGILVVVVAILHTGLRFHDRVAVATLLVLIAVSASGFVGARLYATLPGRLTRVQSNRKVTEISEQLNKLDQAMGRLTAGRSPLFCKVHRQLTARHRPPVLAGWRLIFSRRPTEEEDRQVWEPLLAQLAEEEREPMRQLLMLHRQHRELHLRLRRQQRYKNLLESWLYVHVPLTFALLVLIAVHVAAVFYFGAV